MTDQKKAEELKDADLDDVQGGLYSTAGAGNELYSTHGAGTELMTEAGTIDVKPRNGKRKGDGFITFGHETGL
jgi:hypothetical protein